MQLRVQDTIIHYTTAGNPEHPCLIMTHGWLDSLHTFDQLTAQLQNDYYIVALDWPGFGLSTAPPPTADIAWYSDCLTILITKLALIPIAYIGHSFGARVLLYLFGARSLEFSNTKLICIGGAGIATQSLLKSTFYIASKVFRVVRYVMPDAVFSRLRSRLYKLIGSDYAASGYMATVYGNIIDHDLRAVASNISAKTLLIYGERDQATPVAYGVAFAHCIENSKLEIIKSADHFVQQSHVPEVALLIRQHVRI